MTSKLRAAALAALLSTSLTPSALVAQTAPAPAPVASVPAPAETPWLYENSDIPVDASWTFGELENGLRYAVKRNGVPPDQVSIRIRVDAGSLHEMDDELGYAHLIEHLSFRGSTHVPDGEAKRIWQRFGVFFGSDSNASTTPTQTVYQLDLPNASPTVLGESMTILSGMMRDPRINEASVMAERAIVQAELRENSGASKRLGDATRELYFQGQRLADRSPIGTVATLQKAEPEALQAFHDRWYRPENTVIVIAGDGDPAVYEQLIRAKFSDWQGKGAQVEAPFFGDPVEGGRTAEVVVDSTLPSTISILTARPWRFKNDTIEYNQGLMINLIARLIVNRRLEAKARAGGSYLQASVNEDDISRSANITSVQIVPLGGDWEKALADVRSVIADARTTAPSQEDIDRELEFVGTQFRSSIETYPYESAADQADNIVAAVDIRESVASPQTAFDIFESTKPQVTPAAILAATQAQFEGVNTRILMASPTPIEGGETALASALTSEVVADGDARITQGTLGFDALPDLGAPGTVATTTPLPQLDMEQLTFANGVTALLHQTPAESDTVRVLVRFGKGYQAFSPDGDAAVWSGPAALIDSGVGDLDREALDKLANGRRIGISFGVDDDAFELSAETRPADLAGQLQLLAAKLADPRWAAAPVERAKAAVSVGYPSYETSASSVLQRDLTYLLSGEDHRYLVPDGQAAADLTPEEFQEIWAPQLAAGPIEVLLFGDFQRPEAVAALEASFGALAPREAAAPLADGLERRFAKPGETVTKTHQGPVNQAAVAIAWETGGGYARATESRQMDVLAEIFQDRLFERFRAEQAKSYSPFVSSNWPVGFDSGGYLVAASQVEPENVDRFLDLSREIAADMAANPVATDELQRAVEPIRQLIIRASSGNTFWMNELEGATRNPQKITQLRTLLSDYSNVTPAQIQALAAKFLTPDEGFVFKVLPAGEQQAAVN